MLGVCVVLLAILPLLPHADHPSLNFDVKTALAARQSALHHHEDLKYALTKGYA